MKRAGYVCVTLVMLFQGLSLPGYAAAGDAYVEGVEASVICPEVAFPGLLALSGLIFGLQIRHQTNDPTDPNPTGVARKCPGAHAHLHSHGHGHGSAHGGGVCD